MSIPYDQVDHARAKAEGNCWIERDDGSVFWWPYCIVDGCLNKACLRLNSPRCYPHSLPGVPIIKDVEEETTV